MTRLIVFLIIFIVFSSSFSDQFTKCIAPIIIHFEGYVFTNNYYDEGGPTKFGWTLNTFRNQINPFETKKELKSLTKKQALIYYKKYFWEKYGASKIDNISLALSLILSQINLGPVRPNCLLQIMTNNKCHSNLIIDGILGSKSLKAINSCRLGIYDFNMKVYDLYKLEISHSRWKKLRNGLKNRIFYTSTTNYKEKPC